MAIFPIPRGARNLDAKHPSPGLLFPTNAYPAITHLGSLDGCVRFARRDLVSFGVQLEMMNKSLHGLLQWCEHTGMFAKEQHTGKATTRSFSLEETYFHFRSLRWRDFCIIYFDFAWRHLVQALEWNQKRSWEFEHLHQPRARFKPTPTVRRHFPALDADYTYTVFSCNSDWFLWITESTVIGVIAFSRAWRWLHVHCVFLQLWLVPLNHSIYCNWRNWKLNFQVRK